MIKKRNMTKIRATVKAWLASLLAEQLPSGLSLQVDQHRDRPDAPYNKKSMGHAILTGSTPATDTIRITIVPYEYGIDIDGDQGHYYLGRTGVDSWKYVGWDEQLPTIAGLVAELTEKKTKREAFAKSAIRLKFGNGGWSVSPERLESLKKDLAAGKSISFHPSGFGTGYRVFAKRIDTRYGGGMVSDAATLQALGQSALWFQTMDCD